MATDSIENQRCNVSIKEFTPPEELKFVKKREVIELIIVGCLKRKYNEIYKVKYNFGYIIFQLTPCLHQLHSSSAYSLLLLVA